MKSNFILMSTGTKSIQNVAEIYLMEDVIHIQRELLLCLSHPRGRRQDVAFPNEMVLMLS